MVRLYCEYYSIACKYVVLVMCISPTRMDFQGAVIGCNVSFMMSWTVTLMDIKVLIYTHCCQFTSCNII